MRDVTGWVLKGYHGKGGQEFIAGAPSVDIPPVDKFLSLLGSRRLHRATASGSRHGQRPVFDRQCLQATTALCGIAIRSFWVHT